MDTKPGLSQPDSKVPTVAASAASLSDDGKVSAAGDQTDLDNGTTDLNTAQDEKHSTLDRQPTAASKTGSKIEPVLTREDGEEYPSGMKLFLIVLALCLAVFVMALGKSQVIKDT